MSDWLPEGGPSTFREQYMTPPSLLVVFKQYVKLAKIIQRMMIQVFSPRSVETTRRLAAVESLTLDLQRWQASLPNELQFNQWQPTDSILLPSVAGIQ